MSKAVWVAFLLSASVCGSLAAQETSAEPLVSRPTVQGLEDLPTRQAETVKAEFSSGNRWMLICCGLPGDDEHREKLTTAVERIVNAAAPVFQVESTRLRVLVGDERMSDALKQVNLRTETCTGLKLAETLQGMAKQIQASDSLWIIVLGHAQLYSGRSTFNVQGKDFDATEFSKWLAPVQCRERVLMLTMPVSGFWMKPLRGPRTVIISATDADFEFTGTEMPYALASVVSGNSEQALDDIDQDGSISLLDLYLAMNLEIQAVFKGLERLQTEHAQIDDNGDGVGRELQEQYLPSEDGEGAIPARPVVVKKLPTTNSDGDLARTLKIVKPIPILREATAE